MLPAQVDVLLDALNWIDWFGVACEEGVIQRPDFVFRTVGPSMSQIIKAAERIISENGTTYGDGYWGGVAFVREQLADRGIQDFASDQWRLRASAPKLRQVD